MRRNYWQPTDLAQAPFQHYELVKARMDTGVDTCERLVLEARDADVRRLAGEADVRRVSPTTGVPDRENGMSSVSESRGDAGACTVRVRD
jgi:hypothetical protein